MQWVCKKCLQEIEIGRSVNVPTSSKIASSFVILNRENKQNGNIFSLEDHKTTENSTSFGASRGNIVSKPIDDSFVVLSGTPKEQKAGSNSSQISRIESSQTLSLSRAFDLASQSTEVEHPLCNNCSQAIEADLNLSIRELEEDISAYEACLKSWEAEAQRLPPLEHLERELSKALAEESKALEELESIEAERKKVAELSAELDVYAGQLEDMKQRYWEDWKDFSFKLIGHQESRDSILTSLEVSSHQLENLKSRNVLSDAFHIWFDGDFGTINGFRLGRLPKQPVEWEELNAAWGQVCLLLCSMAQMCRVSFKYQILPMGSFPRLSDGKSTYDLFGPVNVFWSARYDKAMVMFLHCLKEFAEFGHSADRAAGLPEDQCLSMPYRIEEDSVNAFSIKQAFNPDERWTKALKYMLCNLKWAAAWFAKRVSKPA